MKAREAAKAIIFGAEGQDGYYLRRLLEAEGLAVTGIGRQAGPGQGKLTDRDAVRALVRRERPDYIFHLAANSTTAHEALFENHETISTGTWNILEAVWRECPETRVFLSGSGLQFRNTGAPIRETDPFEARDPYAVCRIQSAYAARYYRRLGLRVYMGYFFNHDSPRRSPRHVSRMIADAVRSIASGASRIIEIGKLSVEKEWGFAGDLAEAVWILVRQDKVYEAVLGTGQPHSIADYVRECFALIGKDWKDYVRERSGFTPAFDRLVSDPATIFSLGWKPRHGLADLARMMVTS